MINVWKNKSMIYLSSKVILNYYQDGDFLWKRDGFHFESIQLVDAHLLFSKNEGSSKISLKDYDTAAINSDFQNYYIFRKVGDCLEIYFP